MTVRTLSILPLLLAAASPAAAAPFQDIPALEARLIAALGAGIGQPGGPMAPIDRRLKLAPCPATVEIDPPAMGAVALRCPAIGWRIRVPITRVVAMSAMAEKAAPVVRRGDPVDLVADADGFSVSISAVAQEDGAPGDRIRVRTDREDRKQDQLLFAEVIGAGRVRLPGFK